MVGTERRNENASFIVTFSFLPNSFCWSRLCIKEIDSTFERERKRGEPKTKEKRLSEKKERRKEVRIKPKKHPSEKAIVG